VRECRQNFAHGPMRLKTKTEVVEYKGKQIQCEKSYYGCDFCDFELYEEWMQEKLDKQLAQSYIEKYPEER